MHATVNEIHQRLENAPQEVLDRVMKYLDAMSSEDATDIPQWHNEIINKRLDDYKQNPSNVTDIDVFIDELQRRL